MLNRRHFLQFGVAALGTSALISTPVFAAGAEAQSVTAVTEVFGDGLRFVAVAIEYSGPVAAADLVTEDFSVEGRTVTDVYTAISTDPADAADEGTFVIVALSPDDAGASLEIEQERGGPSEDDEEEGAGPGGPGGGPGAAGDKTENAEMFNEPTATVTASGNELTTTAVTNLIVDDFQQFVWNDPETGDTLQYNLYIPKDYDPAQSYPLVNFMHDAGATSTDVLTTLKQGLGAICFASPEDQAARPAFVLAPQYDEIIVDDTSTPSSMMQTTINLITALSDQYSIDPKRRYTTGQSGGGMMSIAMNIAYPDFFASSFLVACQWDAALVAPMAGNRIFIVVSQDDAKAFPGQVAIAEALEAEGAQVARAVWDATWTDTQIQFAFDDLIAEGANINFVTYAEGTVLDGEAAQGANGHMNTWKYAYTIPQIRKWLLEGVAR